VSGEPGGSAGEFWTDGSFEEHSAIGKGAAIFFLPACDQEPCSSMVNFYPIASSYSPEIAGMTLALQHLLTGPVSYGNHVFHLYTDSQSLVEGIPNLLTSAWDSYRLTSFTNLLLKVSASAFTGSEATLESPAMRWLISSAQSSFTTFPMTDTLEISVSSRRYRRINKDNDSRSSSTTGRFPINNPHPSQSRCGSVSEG